MSRLQDIADKLERIADEEAKDPLPMDQGPWNNAMALVQKAQKREAFEHADYVCVERAIKGYALMAPRQALPIIIEELAKVKPELARQFAELNRVRELETKWREWLKERDRRREEPMSAEEQAQFELFERQKYKEFQRQRQYLEDHWLAPACQFLADVLKQIERQSKESGVGEPKMAAKAADAEGHASPPDREPRPRSGIQHRIIALLRSIGPEKALSGPMIASEIRYQGDASTLRKKHLNPLRDEKIVRLTSIGYSIMPPQSE